MNIFKVPRSNDCLIKYLLAWLCMVSITIYNHCYNLQRTWAQSDLQVSQARPQPNLTQKSRPTPAMEAEATKRINRISDELKSPFCPGKTLLTCTSPEAFKLRREMRQLILEGYDDQGILRVIRQSFDEPLENPPQPWVTILVPVLPFIFGLIIALWMLVHWRRTSSRTGFNQDDPEVPSVDPKHKYYDRLQDLLDDEE